MGESTNMYSTKYMRQKNSSTGFTLVEMLIVAPIVILVIGTIIYAIVQLTGDAVAARSSAALIGNIQSSLDRIEADTEPSGAFLAKNNVTLSSPQGYNDGVQGFLSTSSAGDMLILNTFVTNGNPASASRTLVYVANLPNACGSANIAQNQVMTMNVVYFTKIDPVTQSNELWRRTLAVNNYLSKDCAGVTPWQRPSCSPNVSGTLCTTQDEKLISGVTDFTVQYFSSGSDTTEATNTRSATDTVRQTALDGTNTITVTLKAKVSIAGRDINQQGSVRITRTGSLIKYTTPS